MGPCQKYAIDILNDAATKYDANTFFFSPDRVTLEMKAALNLTLSDFCYGYLQDFQLSGIDLPNTFELAIQETQL
jgi:hypothetical protein